MPRGSELLMRAFKSTMPKPCVLCSDTMLPGCEIWPAQGPDGVQCGRYSHLTCALQAAAATLQPQDSPGAAVQLLAPPVCKHWVRKGMCLMGDACFYRHPAEACGSALVLRQQRQRGGSSKRRTNVRNKWRCSMLRTWLMSRWGPQVLEQGSGVLDVAGGKGELAFELVNLSGVAATVVDPRPVLLSGYIKRLNNGSYHHKQNCGGTNRRSLSDCNSSGSLEPHHLRMPLTLELVAALAALHQAAAAAVGTWGSNMQQQGQQLEVLQQHLLRRQEHQAHEQQEQQEQHQEQEQEQQQEQQQEHSEQQEQQHIGRLRQQCRQLIAAGMAAAVSVDSRVWWLSKSDGHEAGCCSCCWEDPGSEDDESAAAAGEADTVDDDAPADAAGSGVGLVAGALSGLQLSTQQQDDQQQGDQQQLQPLFHHQQQQHEQHLDAAIQSLLSCSVILGMHPDQAAEPIVRLALALRRPFAVVPCCVYAAEFPKRRLPDGTTVRSYEQLLQYLQGLVAMAPGDWESGQQVLPFEGKNIMIWARPLNG